MKRQTIGGKTIINLYIINKRLLGFTYTPNSWLLYSWAVNNVNNLANHQHVNWLFMIGYICSMFA